MENAEVMESCGEDKTRGQKVSFEIFLLAFLFSGATALFILVHLTLGPFNSQIRGRFSSIPGLFRARTPVAYLPAFSRLFGNLFFSSLCGGEEVPRFLSPLIIVILLRRPFSSSCITGFWCFRSYTRAIRSLFSEKNITLYKRREWNREMKWGF